ncbi:MAG TPA: glycosyltransferase family 39 protein [Dehalococcoidia bacterium]|nr:glycosyltransferase family 39 protein [Dehalococcoidia bacterium]
MTRERGLQDLFYAGPALLIAFALRTYRLDGQSLWYDEGNSAFMTTRSLAEIIAGAAADIHPPLYYIFLNWWSQASGTGEFGLRFLSVAFGLLLVAVVYKLGQKLFVPQAGLAAAGIAAISPFLVYYSQEARMYMQGAFLCALAGLFFVKALEGTGAGSRVGSRESSTGAQNEGSALDSAPPPLGSRGTPADGVAAILKFPFLGKGGHALASLGEHRYWAAYTLAAAAALYTQYYTFGVILALNAFFGLAILWRSGRGICGRWLAANLAAAILYAPWLPTMVEQAALWPKSLTPIATSPNPVVDAWFMAPLLVTGPLTFADPVAHFVHFGNLGLVVVLLTIAGLAWPALGRGLPGRREVSMGRWLGHVLVLTVAVVSWLVLLVPIWRPDLNVFNPKFLVFGLPWFYLWIGAGIVGLASAGRHFFSILIWPLRRIGPRHIGVPWVIPILVPTSVALFLFVQGVAIAHQEYYSGAAAHIANRGDYRALAAYLGAQARQGDGVILNAPGQTEIFGYYDKSRVPIHPLPRQRPLDENATGEDLEGVAAAHQRIWLVLWGDNESDPRRFVQRWLDRNSYRAADRWLGGIRLVLYAVPGAGFEKRVRTDAQLEGYARLAAVGLPGVPEESGPPLARAPSGGVLPLTLYWEAIAPPPQRYKVFVHLLGPNATLWGQHDAEPAGGSRPTTDWQPGEAIADNHGLPILPGTPPGRYELEVGLYDPATGRRLGIHDPAGKSVDDRVVLRPIEVTKASPFPAKETLDVERSLEAGFQDVSLLGYEFYKLGTERGNMDFRTGDVAHLALLWRGESRPRADYSIRVALLAASGGEEAAFQGTSVDHYTTSMWEKGEIVRDLYKIPLKLPPGAYRLAVYVAEGLAGKPIPPTGSNLKLVDGKLILAEFQVK